MTLAIMWLSTAREGSTVMANGSASSRVKRNVMQAF